MRCQPVFGHHDPPSAAAQRLDNDQFAARVERVGEIDDLHAIDEEPDMASYSVLLVNHPEADAGIAPVQVGEGGADFCRFLAFDRNNVILLENIQRRQRGAAGEGIAGVGMRVQDGARDRVVDEGFVDRICSSAEIGAWEKSPRLCGGALAENSNRSAVALLEFTAAAAMARIVATDLRRITHNGCRFGGEALVRRLGNRRVPVNNLLEHGIPGLGRGG